MNDFSVVQVLEHADDLGNIEVTKFLSYSLLVHGDEGCEVATAAVLKDKVEYFGILETLIEFEDSRKVHLHEEFSFNEGLILFLLLIKFLFLNLFHGVQSVLSTN